MAWSLLGTEDSILEHEAARSGWVLSSQELHSPSLVLKRQPQAKHWQTDRLILKKNLVNQRSQEKYSHSPVTGQNHSTSVPISTRRQLKEATGRKRYVDQLTAEGEPATILESWAMPTVLTGATGSRVERRGAPPLIIAERYPHQWAKKQIAYVEALELTIGPIQSNKHRQHQSHGTGDAIRKNSRGNVCQGWSAWARAQNVHGQVQLISG